VLSSTALSYVALFGTRYLLITAVSSSLFMCCCPPHLYLTTSKVMVIVWRLRVYYQNCFIYCQRATSSMGTVNKSSKYSPVGPWVCFYVFRLHNLSLCWCMFCFYLGQLSHFPSCCGAGVTNLNEPPSSFLLSPRCCGLGAGSIPLRAIMNKKQCETRGLFMSLVIHYWIGDVQDSQGVSISKMQTITFKGTI